MKTYELLYIIGILIIIASMAIYGLSSTIIINPEQNTASDLLGKITAIDTTLTVEETHAALEAMKRSRNVLFLWMGIPTGFVILLTGLYLKRLKEGPDLFFDDEIENEE